jgi:hypothetical protein
MTGLFLFVLVLLLASALFAVPAGEDDIPTRAATAKREHRQVPLDRLDFASDEYPPMFFCHRADPERDLDPLVDSLVREGQLETVQVWAKPGTDRYLVIAGHRRVKALRRAAEQQTDTSITETMTVECVVITTASKADLLTASLATNAQRQDLYPLEILAAVKKLRDSGVSDARGATAIGYRRTQYERFVAIVENAALYEHVRNGDIGITKAARIVEAVSKALGQGHAQTLDDVLRDFGSWCEERRAEITAAREQYEAAGRKFPENQLQVDHHITTELFKQWVRRLEDGEPILGEASFDYGVLLDDKKARLTIPGISLDLRSARSEHLLKVAEALIGLPHRLVPYIRQAEYAERTRQQEEGGAGPVDPKFEDFLRDVGLDHRLAALRQQAEAECQAQAGEPVRQTEAPQRGARDLGAEIDAGLRRAGASRPPEEPHEDAEDGQL